jgi:flavin reductase (DIM6/NTAB) family NADH-FMN oxidoreductase RutF
MTVQLSESRETHPEVAGPDFRQFMRSWAGGVAIVTAAQADGTAAGCTVNAFMSVSLSPPLALVSLSQQSRTLIAIAGQGSFGINVLPQRQWQLAARFASMPGDRFASMPGDRFAGVPYRLQHGVPVLDAAMAAAVCTLEEIIPAADHVLLLGRPCWCHSDGSDDPAVFFDSAYRALERMPAARSLADGC